MFQALLLGSSGCISREQIRASVWQVWPVPQRFCAAQPELAQYGLYRKLDSGEWEFIPYCGLGAGPLAGHAFFAIYDEDLNAILDGTLPKKEAKTVKRDFAAMRALQWNQTN